jgi:hypothetical protein
VAGSNKQVLVLWSMSDADDDVIVPLSDARSNGTAVNFTVFYVYVLHVLLVCTVYCFIGVLFAVH